MYGQYPPPWGYPPSIPIPPGADAEKIAKLVYRIMSKEEKRREKKETEEKNKKKDDKPKPRVFSFGEFLAAIIFLGPPVGMVWFLLMKYLLQHIN